MRFTRLTIVLFLSIAGASNASAAFPPVDAGVWSVNKDRVDYQCSNPNHKKNFPRLDLPRLVGFENEITGKTIRRYDYKPAKGWKLVGDQRYLEMEDDRHGASSNSPVHNLVSRNTYIYQAKSGQRYVVGHEVDMNLKFSGGGSVYRKWEGTHSYMLRKEGSDRVLCEYRAFINGRKTKSFHWAKTNLMDGIWSHHDQATVIYQGRISSSAGFNNKKTFKRNDGKLGIGGSAKSVYWYGYGRPREMFRIIESDNYALVPAYTPSIYSWTGGWGWKANLNKAIGYWDSYQNPGQELRVKVYGNGSAEITEGSKWYPNLRVGIPNPKKNYIEFIDPKGNLVAVAYFIRRSGESPYLSVIRGRNWKVLTKE